MSIYDYTMTVWLSASATEILHIKDNSLYYLSLITLRDQNIAKKLKKTTKIEITIRMINII